MYLRAWSGCCWPGLLAAFMSNFAATINAAPAYLVNDIYKRFINPHSTARRDIFLSRVASIVVLVMEYRDGVAGSHSAAGRIIP